MRAHGREEAARGSAGMTGRLRRHVCRSRSGSRSGCPRGRHAPADPRIDVRGFCFSRFINFRLWLMLDFCNVYNAFWCCN